MEFRSIDNEVGKLGKYIVDLLSRFPLVPHSQQAPLFGIFVIHLFHVVAVAGFLCAIILWKFKYVDENDTIFKDCSEGYSYWLAVGAAALSGITIILKISISVALCFDKLAYAANE